MIKPQHRPVIDPSKQPKALPPQKALKKQPCSFCHETRKVVKKVAAHVFRRIAGR
jgi:hypothetical protein